MQHLTTTDLVWVVMIGLTVGWLVDQLFSKSPMGLIGHLICGIVGTFFGNLIFTIQDLHGRLLFGAFVGLVLAVLINIYLLDLKNEHDPNHEDVTIIRD